MPPKRARLAALRVSTCTTAWRSQPTVAGPSGSTLPIPQDNERSSPPDWDRLGIAEARRALHETRTLLRRLSRHDRRTAHEIPNLVHALTERLLSIRRDRSILDTVTAQQLEEYTVSARESAYRVRELRRVLRDLTEGGAAPHDVEAAVEGAKDELRLPRRPTVRSRLHEVPEYAQTVDQLDKAVRERRRIEPD